LGYIIDGIVQAVFLIIGLNPEIMDIASLSLKVSGVATLIAAAIGIPLGTFITLNEFPLKGLIKNLIFNAHGPAAGRRRPLSVPGAVEGGPLGEFGLLFTPTAMVIAQVCLILPILTGLTITATKSVDMSVIDTAVSLGADRLHTAAIVLNEARQAIVVAVLAGFGRAIAEVGAVMIVGGDIQSEHPVLTTQSSWRRGRPTSARP